MTRSSTVFLIGVLIVLIGRLATAATIGEARALPDGAWVNVAGCLTYVQPNECYVQSTDRSSGIWVAPGAADIGCAPGELVSVSGTMATTNGERLIGAATVFKVGASSVVRPIAMRNNWLGGSHTTSGVSLQDYVAYKIPGDGTGREWRITRGAPNTGLLVTTWGTVKGDVYYSPVTESHWFYVDDGSGVVADCGEQGIIVYSDADVHNGDFVTVTGISSIETSFDDIPAPPRRELPPLDPTKRLVRGIRPRSSADVRVTQEATPAPVYPFSDEFDSTTLDSRWINPHPTSGYSLSSDPGWLAPSRSDFWQPAPGNWDMVVKVRPRFDLAHASSYQSVSLCLAATPSMFTVSPQRTWLATVGFYGDAYQAPQTSITLCEQPAGVMIGDTCWFRSRMRSHTVYVSVSFDGVSYSPECSTTTSNSCFGIYSRCADPEAQFAPIIDYIRFTLLVSTGG